MIMMILQNDLVLMVEDDRTGIGGTHESSGFPSNMIFLVSPEETVKSFLPTSR